MDDYFKNRFVHEIHKRHENIRGRLRKSLSEPTSRGNCVKQSAVPDTAAFIFCFCSCFSCISWTTILKSGLSTKSTKDTKILNGGHRSCAHEVSQTLKCNAVESRLSETCSLASVLCHRGDWLFYFIAATFRALNTAVVA